MSAESTIREAIRKIAGVEIIPYSQLCTVVSVNEAEMSCVVTPITQGADFADVRLMADPDNGGAGVYFKPKIGSVVMITPQDDVTYFVSMYSEVEEIWLHGSSFGGLVKVTELVAKLNNLESKVNELVNTFNSHIHSGVTTGPGTSGTTATPITGTLNPTQKSDIENPIVKHG